MRLPDFIFANLEPILMEWERFARSLQPGYALEPLPLRDHARDILLAVVADMGTPQSASEGTQKSMGRGPSGQTPPNPATLDGASELHAVGRLGMGFDLMEVVSEYRALRASVLRLWLATNPNTDITEASDLTRFNESIDQSLARAVSSYTMRIDQARDMFLAILSHDLRSPLTAISMSARLLTMYDAARPGVALPSTIEQPMIATPSTPAARIRDNVSVMGRMIGDLLDYTRTRLGAGMPVNPEMMDLVKLCNDVVGEFRSAHPDREIQFNPPEETSGWWDVDRLRQAISNLLGNAIQHGDPAQPIDITLASNDAEVTLAIRNHGDPIPTGELHNIFLPLVRGSTNGVARSNRPGSIGLGLYIAREIALTHGGRIEVTSTQSEGTNFTVILPRNTQTETLGPVLDEEQIVNM